MHPAPCTLYPEPCTLHPNPHGDPLTHSHTQSGGLDIGEKAVEAMAQFMVKEGLLDPYCETLKMYLAGPHPFPQKTFHALVFDHKM